MKNYNDRIKCEKCGAYDSHSPRCEDIDFETVKKQMLLYYEAWLKQEEKHRNEVSKMWDMVGRKRRDAEFWKGKFYAVKLENNALRKKIYKNK